ncbi:MAG: hypothetical protein K0U66_04795 [Gammaproteobacteria bacterium]|nr:hypothetical protein [Gammaproteobacteria bacterium]
MDDKQLYTLLGELKSGVDGIKSSLDVLSRDTHKRIDRLDADMKERFAIIAADLQRAIETQAAEDTKQDARMGKQDERMDKMQTCINKINMKLAWAAGAVVAAVQAIEWVKGW